LEVTPETAAEHVRFAEQRLRDLVADWPPLDFAAIEPKLPPELLARDNQ